MLQFTWEALQVFVLYMSFLPIMMMERKIIKKRIPYVIIQAKSKKFTRKAKIVEIIL